ncbi:MAG: PilZ domain-containing protein [bacterium]|nr:PilZ domain-containing protein [bacterium]
MAEDSSDERRKFHRVHTESLVSIARVDSGDSLAQALDVSIGGIRFQTVGLDLQVGERIRVSLTLGDKTVDIVGELVRVTDLDTFTQELGLSFLEIDPEVLELLQQYLPEPHEIEPADQ